MTNRESISSGRLSAACYAANFADLHPPMTVREAGLAAQHCLYCFDAPCVTACPTDIDVPTFIRKIASGNLPGSGQTILDANILGGTCARACPTEVLCEQACVRNVKDDAAVEIGRLQRHAVDVLIAAGRPHPFGRGPATGKNIAVVGAGPAGLSCAHRLAVLGHEVTIFEARDKSGGLNEYGLAAYKMTDDFAAREVAFVLDVGGISVKHGKALGQNISLDGLRHDYDAVFLGVGLASARSLGVQGEDLDGVRDAVDFIFDLRQDGPAGVGVGDKVIVVGGGNTAIDAAVQARRLGAGEVHLVYRRGPEHMTATGFERTLARDNAVLFHHWARPVEIKGAGAGAVTAVTFEKTRLGADGKLQGVGETFELGADMVLKAVGQTLVDAWPEGLKRAAGKIAVDTDHRTSLAGVYAGGDCILRGEDLTVRAVEDGKRAAFAIDTDLKNQ